jgi:hypothetical protein
METSVDKIMSLFAGQRFDIHDERKMQWQIGNLFAKHGISFKREHQIDSNNIIDFFIAGGIGIEVKIRTQYSKMDIFKQCERYLRFNSIQSLILITSRAMGFPEEINGKPCHVINLSKAWL